MCLFPIRILDISTAVKIFQPAGKFRKFENRPHCGLLFAEYGELHYEQAGQISLSDNLHILFLPKGIDYSMRSMNDSSTFVVNFDVANDDDLPNTIQSFDGLCTFDLSDLLQKIDKLWTLKQTAYMSKSFGLLYTILAKIECMEAAQGVPSGAREIIKKSVMYLEQHFNDPELSNDLLAMQSGISTVYFRKLFQSVYGVPPMRYVQNMRIEKAQALLQSGYMSVTEISEAVGFNSIYHFCRIFKQTEGISATKYMQLSAKTSASSSFNPN